MILSCNKNTNLENKITIKVNSIDSDSKQLRVNTFDVIEVRAEGFGYLMKTYEKVGEYTTDSSGSVKIEIDGSKQYRFMISGPNGYGSANFTEAFTKEKLKDGQEVNIEVITHENR
ncbi:Hypothetical protein KQS_01760 [Flavobacterium indicum GPTSA100-9 = DSM 17447]|uniref:Uncharacterized protein n=2 Tax=Flavobacterium TaxID=237 RepID=H8XQ50_FLAIG|nr:Hypothetical protein KQS_01760 [Flavobacterium indicum GPTSA100-9 = DSM 17447]